MQTLNGLKVHELINAMEYSLVKDPMLHKTCINKAFYIPLNL